MPNRPGTGQRRRCDGYPHPPRCGHSSMIVAMDLMLAFAWHLRGSAPLEGGRGIVGRYEFAGFAFAWLYGANILLALVRVPTAIRRGVPLCRRMSATHP